VTKLTRLHLGGAPITDAGLVHLTGLIDLCDLNRSGTQATVIGMADLKRLTKLSQETSGAS
jgi:hypothetical protein